MRHGPHEARGARRVPLYGAVFPHVRFLVQPGGDGAVGDGGDNGEVQFEWNAERRGEVPCDAHYGGAGACGGYDKRQCDRRIPVDVVGSDCVRWSSAQEGNRRGFQSQVPQGPRHAGNHCLRFLHFI